jgi:hypothetical protein
MSQTFASLLSDRRMAAEEVARLLGHSPTGTFEMVYRHVLKLRRRDGQAVMTLSPRGAPADPPVKVSGQTFCSLVCSGDGKH